MGTNHRTAAGQQRRVRISAGGAAALALVIFVSIPGNALAAESEFAALGPLRVQIAFGNLNTLLLLVSSIALVLAAGIVWHYRSANHALRRGNADRDAVREYLMRRERRHRLLVEHAPFAVLVLDEDGQTVHYVNSRAARMFRLPDSERREFKMDQLLQKPADRVRFNILLSHAGCEEALEAPMVRQDGTEFWASLCTSRAQMDDDESVIMVGLTDISLRKDLEERLRRAANYDALTGLPNRRCFFRVMEREQERAARYQRPICIMMMDLDRFKSINDTFGHQGGDRFLCEFANLCRSILRGSDVIGRLGGEEFAVLLPETEVFEARDIAERLRREVEELNVCGQTGTIHTTVSIGLVTVGAGESLEHAIDRADRAMYEVKGSGRNGVRTALV